MSNLALKFDTFVDAQKAEKLSYYLLREIHRRGITRVFGVPGRENAKILFNEVPGIEFVTTRIEFNAGIMAEFTGRMTQKPQVAFCTMGPGATNMVTAAASAMLNRSPLLVVSAQLESDDRFYNLTHQCVDQKRIFDPVTKWSCEVECAEDFPDVLDRAFEVMMAEPLGPVHLSVPVDLFDETALTNDRVVHEARPTEDAFCHNAEPSSISCLYNVLRKAQKPLCLVGFESIRANAENQIRTLCDTWNISLLAAANAKGILPHDDPKNIGSVSPYMEGILQYPTALAEVFDDVDLILNIGYQYVDDILPKMWTRGKNKHVVHVSAFPAEPIRTKYSPNLQVLGNIKNTLHGLLAYEVFPKARPGMEKLKRHIHTIYEARSDDGKMTPTEVIRVINNNLKDGTFVTDIGYYRHHAILFGRPSRTKQFFTDSGLSTFGCGLPSAAAAQFLDRSKPVFLLCGDGGFHSGSGDLETLVRHNLPVVIIVLNNNSFGLIQRYQQRGGRGENAKILTFNSVSFVKLAEANGLPAGYAATVDQLQEQISGRDLTRPLLIEVPLEYHRDDKFVESF